MSVEPQVLCASTIAGLCGGATSQLANTGNPVAIGMITGVVIIVVLGLVTRATQTR
jgi:hypothetical protein